MSVAEKFDSNFFDEEFYRSSEKAPIGIGLKGAKRDGNSPYYIEYAAKMKEAFAGCEGFSILDIGGGMGWRTMNHIENGFDAYACDISRWAFENSIMPSGKHYCMDIRDVGQIERQFDIVNVERILEYLPASEMFRALEAAWSRVRPGGFMVASIICSDHRDQSVVFCAQPGRLNICPRDGWLEIFFDLGAKIDEDKTKIFLGNDWDCVWVWRKDE